MATAKKLPSGNWSVNIYVGKDKDGKRKYKRFTGPDKRKVEREAAAYADEHRGEVHTDTFGYAARQYIEMKKNVLSPSTIRFYSQTLAGYFASWENTPVANITSANVQAFINDLAVDKSPKTVRNIYGFMTAVIYSVNPNFQINVTLPARERKFKELPTPEAIYNAVKDTKWELPVMLSMWLSLRMSEVRGLRFSDITGDILTVRNALVLGRDGYILKNTTKTYTSTRKLFIPRYIKELIAKAPGSGDDFIVPYAYSTIYKGFQRALKTAGLPSIPFHDLRHMNASIMLRLGVPDKYAMERGGWSSTNVLKSVYQNTFSEARMAVDRKIDDYFEGIIFSKVE